jgi:hypothetical protein
MTEVRIQLGQRHVGIRNSEATLPGYSRLSTSGVRSDSAGPTSGKKDYLAFLNVFLIALNIYLFHRL